MQYALFTIQCFIYGTHVICGKGGRDGPKCQMSLTTMIDQNTGVTCKSKFIGDHLNPTKNRNLLK